MLRDLINKIVGKTKRVVPRPSLFTGGGEFLLKATNFGRIRVEYVVVQKIAERALSQVEGILEPVVDVEKTSSTVTPFKIQLTLALAEGHSAPAVSAAADTAINGALSDFLRLEFYVPVVVKVKQITQTAPKRRRVR